MTTELIEVKPVITGSLPMMPQQSGSVEIRASKSVETKVPLRYMEYMLYFLVFMILMFNTPFFIFVPIWIKNEFENGDRRQYWGDVTQETMLLIILIIGSLDFLQPLLTPYIKNHIRLQCKVSFIAGVIANFLFLCASFKAVSGPLVSPVMMSVIAAIFTGICNCSHLFEYFIREMTKDKKRQSEIIENVAICQILGIIVVTAICSTTHDFGEENDKQGFAYLNGVSLAFGIIGTGVLYYFIQCLPPKPYYPPLSAGPACSLKNMWNTAFKGLPGPVCVILAVRFVISFNFGMFRVIISPNFDNMLDAMPNMRKNKTVIMGAMFCIAIVISMSFLYLMRDTFHRNKWIWFPYIQLCISGYLNIMVRCLLYSSSKPVLLSNAGWLCCHNTLTQNQI